MFDFRKIEMVREISIENILIFVPFNTFNKKYDKNNVCTFLSILHVVF